MNPTLLSRFKPDARFVFRPEIDRYAILFDPETGRTQVLNPSAAAVFVRFDGQKSLAEIFANLRAEFEDIPSEAEEQILALATELLRAGVIRESEV